jgi:hypothetical protein
VVGEVPEHLFVVTKVFGGGLKDASLVVRSVVGGEKGEFHVGSDGDERRSKKGNRDGGSGTGGVRRGENGGGRKGRRLLRGIFLGHTAGVGQARMWLVNANAVNCLLELGGQRGLKVEKEKEREKKRKN